MALSDYESLSVNEKGQPINGLITSPEGVTVEIYKNWVYIQDPKAWTQGGWKEPTVMQIQQGLIQYKDITILALRGPQDGCYVVASYNTYDNEVFKEFGMIGCGIRGTSTDKLLRCKYVNVFKSSLRWFHKELNKKRKTWSILSSFNNKGGWTKKKDEYMIDLYDVPDFARKETFKNATRFNQGDAYFSKHINTGEITSEVGKGKKPLISKMLNG